MQEQYSSIESVTREDIFKSLIQDDSLVKAIANTAEDFLSDKVSISESDKNGNGLSYYMFDRSDRSKDENLVNTDTLVLLDEDGNPTGSVSNYIVRPQLLWLKIIPHMGSDDVVLTSGSFIFFDLFDDRSTNIAKNFQVRFYVVSREDNQSVKQYPTKNGKTSFYRPDYICDRIQYIFAKTDNKYVGQGENKVTKPIEATAFSGRSPFSLAGGYYGCAFTMDCSKVRCL